MPPTCARPICTTTTIPVGRTPLTITTIRRRRRTGRFGCNVTPDTGMPAAAPTFQRRPYQYAEMSPEMQLLCLSATTSLPAKNKEQIAHLLAGARLDWAEVVRQAEWHGTTALLATNICEQGFDVPPDAVKQLKAICRTSAQQSSLLP